MNYLFKSRFYREEFLRWGLIITLGLWALTATCALALKTQKTIIIGVGDDSSYIIEQTNLKLERREKLSFLREFVRHYYNFDQGSFDQQISKAGDMMANDLWDQKQSEFLKIREGLKQEALIQSAEIKSIDEVEPSKIELDLVLTIKRKLSEQKVRAKAKITLQARERSETNPYPFEVVGLSDAAL